MSRTPWQVIVVAFSNHLGLKKKKRMGMKKSFHLGLQFVFLAHGLVKYGLPQCNTVLARFLGFGKLVVNSLLLTVQELLTWTDQEYYSIKYLSRRTNVLTKMIA